MYCGNFCHLFAGFNKSPEGAITVDLKSFLNEKYSNLSFEKTFYFNTFYIAKKVNDLFMRVIRIDRALFCWFF